MITQIRLKEVLDYDPVTGLFNWKRRMRGTKFGSAAGWVNDSGYLCIRVDGTLYRAQRLAWLYVHGVYPKGVIDHIDRNRLNNSIVNLRDITKAMNQRNLSKSIANTSTVTGVTWYKAGNKWHAQITVDRKKIHLGYFDKFEDAVIARKEAEVKFEFTTNHGE